MWAISHSVTAVAAAVAVSGLAIVLLEQRRWRREAAELEAARVAALAQERARGEEAERQRELAAQVHDVLFVSLATVKTHINHLLAKTRCTSRADLVRYAYERGLTE